MGRKPNQLVLEFFDRGPKLEDASNRYQYFCKACGAHFPKGRMDSLTSHLSKRCTALLPEDRRRALVRLHEIPEDNAESFHAEQAADAVPPNGTRTKLPLGGRRKLTGLEALAEASRQVEFPEKSGHSGRGNETAIDPTLKELGPYEKIIDATVGVQSDYAPTAAYDTDPFSPYHPSQQSSSSVHTQFRPSLTSHTASDLSSIAASASTLEALLPHVQLSTDHDDRNENQITHEMYAELQAPRTTVTWPPERPVSGQSSPGQVEATVARALTYPRAITSSAPDPLKPDSGNFRVLRTASPRVQKIRGKFSDSRRKEVLEVRKKGACIRCRMLRKTCSGGDPCMTCANVESARVWKTPCMRTRVANEFELYFAGLHARLAEREMVAVTTRYRLREFNGRIVISHNSYSNIRLDCGAVACYSREDFGDEDKGEVPPLDSSIPTLFLLQNAESYDIPGKLGGFLKDMIPVPRQGEPSDFSSIVLRTALSDLLLTQVLQLWTITQLLIDSQLHWHFQLRLGTQQGFSKNHTESSQSSTGLDADRYPEIHALLVCQLRALTEKKAADLCRTILNDLEKRLLQRSQCQGFETLLVAIILLICVEKMCWLFHIWDADKFSVTVCAGLPHESEMATISDMHQWPLEQNPSHYTSQGDSFSDLVCMLLKIRGVPPKTRLDAEHGFLVPTNVSDLSVIEWFESVKLTNQFLEQRRNSTFNAADSRSFELKYCSKLLLL